MKCNGSGNPTLYSTVENPGIVEILSEVDIEVVGIGVAIVNTKPEKKKVSDYFPIVYLGDVDENNKFVEVIPNCQIF